jgi:uncharacterized protein YjbI with pentapeptide repeats
MATGSSTTQTSAGFIGRHNEIERFGKDLGALKTGRAISKRFLHLYGPAGIGKSTLLREYARICRSQGVVYANVSFEEERLKEDTDRKNLDPYAEALFIIATQLARQGIEAMDRLRNQQDDLQLQTMSSDPQQRNIASQSLAKFPDRVLEELVTLAHERPVVLFIDGLEDPAESVRESLEFPLLIRFAEAPQSMVVSASRATLPATWSGALQNRFVRIQVPPLSSQEITQLVEEVTPSRHLPHAQIVRNGPLMEVVHEIGQGHVPVSELVFGFLVNLLAELAKQSGDKKIEPQSVHELNSQQMGDLLNLIRDRYLEPYALRDLQKDPWGERVYRATIPARYLDEDSLKMLIRAINIERNSSAETERRALGWLEERGLVHYSREADLYRLDALPRDLLLRQMKHFSPEQLQTTTRALRDIYKSQIKGGVDSAPGNSLAIIEYLYHSYVDKQLQGVSQTARENEIVKELELCLKGSSSPRTVEALRRSLENDSELATVFGQRLTSRTIEIVRSFFPTEPGDNSTSRLIAEREALISDILAGNCVLFLGPGLTLGSDYLAMFETLAQRLNEENGYKETVTRFEDVAQYYAGLPDKGRDKLIAEYMDYVEQHLNPDQSSLDVIVSLPFHNIITTTTDASLEIAYQRARWPVEVVTSPLASPRIERGEDLLIKLFGSLVKIDKLGARLDTHDTLILTRREQLQLQANLAGADNLLDSHLRAGVPLFIGFDHRDPNLYFLHTLVHRSSHLSGRRSYVALEEPNQFLGQAWQTEMVILDQCGRDLLQELQERWLDWQSNQMHLWDEAEVLEAIQAERSVAGKLMSRIVFEEHTDLIGRDMSSCVLTAGVLNGVLLNEALLERADLSNATLQDAQLKNCKARGANLTYANANRAQLGGAQFAKAVLTGVSMHDVEITGAVFDETDLIFAELEGARGERPSFLNANLVGIDFSGARLPEAAFRDSLIWDGNFRRAKLTNADFSMANLAEAGFERSDLRGANFYFANLTGADFSGADVRGANFSQALLAGADLRDAVNVSEAKFTNATWQEAKLTPELRQQLEQAETVALQAGLPPGRLFELAHEALSGRCILFVGPGLTLGPQYLDTYDRIKTVLAKECGLSESGLGFQDVAQYFAATKSRDSLIQQVTQELRSSFQVDNAGLDLVVSLPFDVILTTALDTELESAYGRAGRPFERIVSLEKSVVLEKDEDLIIRLYGGIDVMDAPLVLTRRDRYQMQDSLAHNDSALSKYIGSRVPLFVGFSLRDPALYMLHTLISKPDAPLAGKSFVALDEPCSFFGEAWKSESLVILDRSSHNLLEDLHHQWVEQKSAERRIWNTAEVLEAIHAGRSVAGKRISRISLEEGSDLQKQDLSYCMLTSGTLNGVLLNGALLPGADLSNSEMEDAELSNCNLLGANMFRVKLNRAKLDGADLGKAVLVQAALRDVDLDGARLAEADLIFADLQGASGKGVDFTRANFSNALLSGSVFPGAGFRSSFGERAEFRHAELSGADFQMSNLAETKFEGANLTGASFHASNLTGADFSNADLSGVDFSQARLDGVYLNDANNVLEADFTDSAWQKALLSEALRQKLEQDEIEAGSEK